MAKRAINFIKMKVSELAELRDQIERALEKKIASERAELQAQMQALSAFQGKKANGSGHGAAKTSGRAPGRRGPHPLKGRSAPVKYRGPNGETWAGRGLAPRWLTALEKKGKKRDTFLIDKTS